MHHPAYITMKYVHVKLFVNKTRRRYDKRFSSYIAFNNRSAATTPWRNGSASDSRSEGCVFKSRRGQKQTFFFLISYI